MTEYENKYLNVGYQYIAGIDEAGRGPIAGPVVAAAVILKPNFDYGYINDSKKLSQKKLVDAYDAIINNAIVGIGIVDNNTIDKINILEATKLAMRNAVDNLEIEPEVLLVDAVELKGAIISESIIKGDQKSISIAAASIIAKVTRDRIMIKYDENYPEYNFKKHKGYPTKEHKEKVFKNGICEIHRKTFAPIKFLEQAK